jgi:hypothetical protein
MNRRYATFILIVCVATGLVLGLGFFFSTTAQAYGPSAGYAGQALDWEPLDLPAGPENDIDPQLNAEIGPGDSYVLLENSQIEVRYESFTGGEHEEFAIRDFIIKGVSQDQAGNGFLDAAADRETLKSASIVYSGTDRITVRLEWNHETGDPTKEVVHEVSIFPNQPFLKINYLDTQYGLNVVDIGRPGGTNNGTHVAYGGDSWIRDYVIEYCPTINSYYNRFDVTDCNGDPRQLDPADGGSLNYSGHFILGVYNGSNGVGFGRVMPVVDVDIIKLLFGTGRRGMEFFPHALSQPHAPFTGYLYGVTGGASEMISFAQQIVDDYFGEVRSYYLPIVIRSN